MSTEARIARIDAAIAELRAIRADLACELPQHEPRAISAVPPPERYSDPIEELRRQIVARGGVWDTAIDHIQPALFMQASTLYATTIGKGDAKRSVEGFKQHVMQGIEEAA